MTADDERPFSFPVKVRSLPSKGRTVTFEADSDVAVRIAEENHLLLVKNFIATAHVSRWRGDGVSILGRVSAALVQACAVSGEPLETLVAEEFETIFVPQASKLAKPRFAGESEWIFDPEGDDIPDTFTGDTIDLADPWLETFVLGLDPFARIEGAEIAVDVSEDVKESPFAALAQLKPH